MDKNCTEKDKNDQLSQNYQNMNETGKEKLKEISKKIVSIWKIVNKKDKNREWLLMTNAEFECYFNSLIGDLKIRVYRGD